jgi:hypothetical protein
MARSGRLGRLFDQFWNVFRLYQDGFNFLYRPEQIFVARRALDSRSIFSKGL